MGVRGMVMAMAMAVTFSCITRAQQVKTLREEETTDRTGKGQGAPPLPLLGVQNHTQPPSWLLKLPSELRGGEMKLSLRKMRRVGSESSREVSLLRRSLTAEEDFAALTTTTHRQERDGAGTSSEGSALPPSERDWHKKIRAAWNSMLTNARVGLLAQGKLLVEPQLKGPASDLMSAALAGNPLVLSEELRKEHVSVNIYNEMGETPLMLAAISGNTSALALLLARGAHLDARDVHGWTALMKAVALGDTEMVKFLLDAGADVKIEQAENNAGQSAVSIAKMWGKKKAAQLLIDASPVETEVSTSSHTRPARQNTDSRRKPSRHSKSKKSNLSQQAQTMKGAVIRACADSISEADELKQIIEDMEARMRESDEIWIDLLKRKSQDQIEQYQMIKNLEKEVQMSQLQVENLQAKLEAYEVSKNLNQVSDEIQEAAAGLSAMSKTLESSMQMLMRKLGLNQETPQAYVHPVPSTKFDFKKNEDEAGKCPRWQNQIDMGSAQECRASVSLHGGSEGVRTTSTCEGLEVVSVETSRSFSAQQQVGSSDAAEASQGSPSQDRDSSRSIPPKMALREDRLELREAAGEGPFRLRTTEGSSAAMNEEEEVRGENVVERQETEVLSVWSSFLKNEVVKHARYLIRGIRRTILRVGIFLR